MTRRVPRIAPLAQDAHAAQPVEHAGRGCSGMACPVPARPVQAAAANADKRRGQMGITQTSVIWAAVLGAQPAPAPSGQAGERPHGLYLSLGGALLMQQDNELSSPGGIPLQASLMYEPGVGMTGGVGYTWLVGEAVSLSLELEYAYRRADISSLDSSTVMLSATGYTQSHAIMLNGLAAVDLGAGFGLYAGGGVGPTITAGALTLDIGGPLIELPEDNDTTFAWQVMGGVQYAFNTHLVMTLGVRYFDAGVVSFEDFGGSNRSLGLELGLRVYF